MSAKGLWLHVKRKFSAGERRDRALEKLHHLREIAAYLAQVYPKTDVIHREEMMSLIMKLGRKMKRLSRVLE